MKTAYLEQIQPVGGAERVYVYENAKDKAMAVELPTGVVLHSKTDHLGRKTFDELHLRRMGRVYDCNRYQRCEHRYRQPLPLQKLLL